MKALRYILTAILSLFVCLGIVRTVSVENPFIPIIVTLVYFSMLCAVNYKGGKTIIYLTYFFSVLFTLLFIGGAVASLVIPEFAEQVNLAITIGLLVFSSVPALTFYSVKTGYAKVI